MPIQNIFKDATGRNMEGMDEIIAALLRDRVGASGSQLFGGSSGETPIVGAAGNNRFGTLAPGGSSDPFFNPVGFLTQITDPSDIASYMRATGVDAPFNIQNPREADYAFGPAPYSPAGTGTVGATGLTPQEAINGVPSQGANNPILGGSPYAPGGYASWAPVLDNGQQVGEINTGMIDEAVNDIPPIDVFEPQPETDLPTEFNLDDLLNDIDQTYNQGQVNETIDEAAQGNIGEQPSVADQVQQGGNNPFDFSINNPILNSILYGSVRPEGGDMPTTIEDWIDLAASGDLGGNSSNTNTLSTILQDLVGNITNNAGDILFDAGFNELQSSYLKDANKQAMDFANAQIARQEPFRQLGINNLQQLQEAARTNPQLMDLFANQMQINPNTDVQGPQASSVDVNQIDPFNINDPALQYLINSGSKALENSAAARGKLYSPETMQEIQDYGQGAALNRANQLVNIGATQDSNALRANQQQFGQQYDAGAFDLGQQQANIANQFGLNDQLFNQNLGAGNYQQNADTNAFNQLSQIVGNVGLPASLGQSSTGVGVLPTVQGGLSDNALLRYNQTGNVLSNLFRGGGGSWATPGIFGPV